MTLMLEQVQRRLADTSAQFTQNSDPPARGARTPRPAAVLIPMLEVRDGWHLLYIRRAENGNDDHSGQVAFPGGCRELGDANLKATALREAREEIGLSQRDVKILGRLRDFISATNFHITPFVGLIPWPYPLQLAPSEVARTFTIPLHWLADANNRETYQHPTPAGAIPVIRFRPYAGELLWGTTARMTVDLIQALAGRTDPDTGG